jgi:DNA-directed RNA polymerase specialized sigma24 family protein
MDPTRFKKAYASYKTQLIAYAEGLLCGRRAVAEERVQEAYLQFWLKGQDADNDRNWLYNATRCRVFDWLRKHQPEKYQFLSGDAQDPESPDVSVMRSTVAPGLTGDQFTSRGPCSARV